MIWGNYKGIAQEPATGMCVASLIRKTHLAQLSLIVLTGSELMGCLVLDTVDSHSVEGTIAITDAPDTQFPIDQFIVIDQEEPATTINLSVDIHDLTGDALEWVLTQDQGTVLSSDELPESEETVRRLQPPGFSSGVLVQGCHRLKLFVSHNFRPGVTDPETPGDLGTAVWWAGVVNVTFPDIDPASCGGAQ